MLLLFFKRYSGMRNEEYTYNSYMELVQESLRFEVIKMDKKKSRWQ